MPTTTSRDRDISRTAHDELGFDELRPGQLEAVSSLVAGTDTLVVMPTGAGKSAVYQVAGLLLDGPTVVVSPLIALQSDQLEHLRSLAGAGAVAVNSDLGAAEQEDAWTALAEGDARFVFLAPEQLAKEDVVDRLAALRPALLVVDEAHCVSSWGHDFRPDYLRVGAVLEQLGRPVVAALTATAAPPVRAEIVERLRLDDPRQVVQGFDRPEIELQVRRFVDDRTKRAAVVDAVRAGELPALVYTGTRKSTEQYAEELSSHGLRVAAYHAGLRAAVRQDVHEEFLAGRLDVVVATSAFGMGIDKPDVRLVVHADITDSLDSYYQEIGRVGRDGEPALALLTYRPEDLGLRRFQSAAPPAAKLLRSVGRSVADADGHVPLRRLQEEVDASRAKVTQAVNLLEQAGGLRGTDGGAVALGEVRPADAVAEAQELAEAHRRTEASRLEMVRGYAETTGCRRQLLLGYFGEQLDEPCGNCDTCAAGTAAQVDVDAVSEAASEFPLQARVQHREWGEGEVMHVEADRLTVLFGSVGYRTLALEAARREELLSLVEGPSGG